MNKLFMIPPCPGRQPKQAGPKGGLSITIVLRNCQEFYAVVAESVSVMKTVRVLMTG
jgi:hypothetical protein